MATTTIQFESGLTPPAALAAFMGLAEERGWRPRGRTGNTVEAKRPINRKTWGDRIKVTATPVGDSGSVVEVRVSSWQLFDWGAGKTIATSVQERLI